MEGEAREGRLMLEGGSLGKGKGVLDFIREGVRFILERRGRGTGVIGGGGGS